LATRGYTVLLTGATGFVGRNILAELLRQDYRVRCLVGIIREAGSQTFERVHIDGTHNVVAGCTTASADRLASHERPRGLADQRRCSSEPRRWPRRSEKSIISADLGR